MIPPGGKLFGGGPEGGLELEGGLAPAGRVGVGAGPEGQLLGSQGRVVTAEQRGKAAVGLEHPSAPLAPRALAGLDGGRPSAGGHLLPSSVADPHGKRVVEPEPVRPGPGGGDPEEVEGAVYLG